MITNPLIKQLNTKLQEGAIDQRSYGIQLKRVYDRIGSINLSEDDIKYLEKRLTDLKIPFAKEEATDGLIKQTVSGFIEGFTTFGFADAPDTTMEKMFNNVAHLIGLAPGVVMGGIGMLSGASKVVSANLKRQAKKAGDKRLKKMADDLEKLGEGAGRKQTKLQQWLSDIAEKTVRIDDDGKVINFLAKDTGKFNPFTLKPIYDLKSIPGRLADKTQNLGKAFLGKNRQKHLEWFTKNVLRNKFSAEKLGNIINESVHVGLLMAYSQHPLATRNEEGFKQTLQAGMHGGLAGGIFGSIGQYANISTLLNSTNKSVRAIGEGMVRSTARNLSYSTSIEREAVVNTMMKSIGGAGFGIGTSVMNDLPPEDVIYETLMGIFFSVNGRPAFENRATADIMNRSRAIPREKKTEKSMKAWLYKQEWYQNETQEYKNYMKRHVEAIYRQQEKIVGAFPLAKLEYQKILQKALEDEIITPDEIRDIYKRGREEEAMFAVMEKVRNNYNKRLDPNYTPPPSSGAYDKTKFINLVKLTDQLSLRAEVTRTNEADFPVHDFDSITFKIYNALPQTNVRKTNVEQFRQGLGTIWKESIKEHPGSPKEQLDSFVNKVENLLTTLPAAKNLKKKGVKLTPSDKRKIRKIGTELMHLSPKKNVEIVTLIDENGQAKKAVPVISDIPPESPEGAPVHQLTGGNRQSSHLNNTFKKGYDLLPDFVFSTVDYIEVMVKKPIVNQRGERDYSLKRVWINPLSRNPFDGEMMFDPVKLELAESLLNKDRKFIFGGISDTGRLDIRSFPWARYKYSYTSGRKRVLNPNFLSKEQVHIIAKKLKGKLKESGDLAGAENITSTYIYRLMSLNIIKNPSQINYEFLMNNKTMQKWVQAEKDNGSIGVVKLQKYLNQVDKTEVPFFSETPNEKYKGIIVEDPPSNTKDEANSGVDGVIVFNNKRFDYQGKGMGIDKLANQAKGTLWSGADGTRGDVVGKFAYKRADQVDQAYLEKHGLDFYIYTSAAKHNGGVKVSKHAKGALPSGRKTKSYDYSLNTFEVFAKDFHMNLNIYESIPTNVKNWKQKGAAGERTSINPEEHSVNIMQELFLNANTLQFNPNDGGVGEAFHRGWKNMVRRNAIGDRKENAYVRKQFKKGKALREDLSIDDIDIRILDKILSGDGIKTKTAESIIKKLVFGERESSLARDYEQEINENYISGMLKDVLADNDFSHIALAQKGNSEWVQKTFRKYVMGRLVRPKVKYTYKSILGPYDYKIAQKKQKYSSAKKGLAKNEFMLMEGAEDLFYLKIQGQEVTLGEWWKDFKGLTDNPNNYASWSNSKKQAYKDAQWALINRSPVITAGNVRALKFVGFVRGQGVKNKRGTGLVTNERNDRYMGGADKDIDSAHVSFGMPKNILEGYKQEHVRSEMQKGQKDSGKAIPLKNRVLTEEHAGAVYDATKVTENKLILEHLDFHTRLNAARNMAFGKDTIGIIHNMHSHAKSIIDLMAQNDPKYRTKKGRAEIEEFFHNFLLRNAAVSNEYIDMDARNIWDAKQTEGKIYKDLENYFGRDVTDILQTMRDFHNASMKGILPRDKQYQQVAQDMLDLYGDAVGYKKIVADFMKDMTMTIDPFAGYEKDNIFMMNQKAIRAILDDPMGQFFGIRDTIDIFNPERLLTPGETQNIYDHPHFLYNKMNVVGILKSIVESNQFIQRNAGGKLGLNASDLQLFVREIAHIAYAQKQGIFHQTSVAKNYVIDPERMTYNEQVLLSKQYLKDEIRNYFKNKTAKLGKTDKKEVDAIAKDVERLFEFWHIAFPYLELDYSGMDVARNNRGEKKDLKNNIHSRYVAFIRQAEKVRQIKDKSFKNGRWKNDTERRKYEKEKETLGAMEWEAEGLVNRGANNMQRASSISKETRMEMNEFYQKYLEITLEKDTTIQEMELNKLTDPYIRIGYERDTAPGEVVPGQIESTGRFVPESLIDWKTIESIETELPKSIKRLEKEVKDMNITSEEVIFEAKRFGDNIRTILKSGHGELGLQITELYTGMMQKLDIVAKQPFDEADYNRIKILNNIIENRYLGSHKEWAQRLASHKKLIEEWKELGKDPMMNLLPPDAITDMAFPTELSKFLSKYERVFIVDRVQLIDPKTGRWKEYGARMPSSTNELMNKDVARMHDAGNALKKAYEDYWNGLMDTIRPTDEALFVEHKEALFGLAAMERQLGIGVSGRWDRKTTPRDVEHEVSKEQLEQRLDIARKEFNAIPDGQIFVVQPRAGGDPRKMTKRDMVETIKEELYKPLFTKALNEIIRSNHERIAEILNTNLLPPSLNYEKFFGGNENIVTKIISGAQSGADIGGLEAGRSLGIEIDGLAPAPRKGKTGFFRSELTDNTSDAKGKQLARKYYIRVDKSSSFAVRTKKNVKRSDSTIAFILPTVKSTGTSKTIGYAQTGLWQAGNTTQGIYKANPKNANTKPVLVLNSAKLTQKNIDLIRQFLIENPGTLNIAGHRESSTPGLQKDVTKLLVKAIKGLKQAHPWSDPSHPKHFEYRLSELFLDEHGLVDINKVRVVHEYNMATKELQSGERVIERQYHEDDLTFLHRQLDIYENVIGFLKKAGEKNNEQYITSKANQFQIDWAKLQKSNSIFKNDFHNDAKMLENKIKHLNQEYINQIATGMIGTTEINGDLFSNRYWALMGQQDTAAGRRYVEEVHIPNEIARINRLTRKDFEQEDRYLYERLQDGVITLKDARLELATNMVNKLLKDPLTNNEMLHESVEQALHSLSTRQLGLDKPGAYKPTFVRRRPTIPVGNYLIDDTVPVRYLTNLANGLTQGIAALQTRINLLSFRENANFNKQIGKEEAKAWHLKMIDIVRGHMGYPTTRNIDLHGISKKDQKLLIKWAESGFDDMFYQREKVGPVERKLMKDFKQQTTLRREEVAAIEKETLAKYSKAISKTKKKYFGIINKAISKNASDDEIKEIKSYRNRVLQSMRNKMKAEIKDKIENAELDIRIEALKDENVDKTNIKNSFRSFYSDETVGNMGLRLDNAVNTLFGTDVNNKIPFLKEMPDLVKDPQGRHRAWVKRANWLSDIEGKFEMMALLAHPKSAVANAYGGTTNTITDVGFKHFFESLRGEALVNKHFRGIRYEAFDPQQKKWVPKTIETKSDVYEYFELRGFVENNIRDELIMYKPPGDVQWRRFSNHVGERITEFYKRHSVNTRDKELNEKNRLARKEYREITLLEGSKKFGVNKKIVDAGAFFMKHSEYHLRMQSAISHYLKAKEIFTDTNGNTEVSEAFLLEFAKRGVAASQFIYHATNRPNFANTAIGRIMTRFHPYSWNSIRRRADVIRNAQIADGNMEFEAGKRFERQLSADFMTAALATVFAASIFEYALSPPMNWSMDFAQLMFGDPQQKERAFYNQYGHPLLNPLQIVSPPASRFVVPVVVGMVNADFEAFHKYTLWTWAPFGRVARDLKRTYQTPEMAGEWMFGVPVHRFGQHIRRNEKIDDSNIENEE